MSKHQKALAKLCSKPTPKDFTWNELKNVMEHFGFETISGSGSSRRFHHAEKNINFLLHEPHPQKTILICYINEIVKFLEEHKFTT